jgi:hypothetical protein
MSGCTSSADSQEVKKKVALITGISGQVGCIRQSAQMRVRNVAIQLAFGHIGWILPGGVTHQQIVLSSRHH